MPVGPEFTTSFAGGEALSQLWVSWAVSILGAVIGAVVYNWMDSEG